MLSIDQAVNYRCYLFFLKVNEDAFMSNPATLSSYEPKFVFFTVHREDLSTTSCQSDGLKNSFAKKMICACLCHSPDELVVSLWVLEDVEYQRLGFRGKH